MPQRTHAACAQGARTFPGRVGKLQLDSLLHAFEMTNCASRYESGFAVVGPSRELPAENWWETLTSSHPTSDAIGRLCRGGI
jgi:hypothetical protein